MPKVNVCVDLEEETYRTYREESRRRGVTVESLIQDVVNRLHRELEAEVREGADHPIIPS
jgi:hypothetical protein